MPPPHSPLHDPGSRPGFLGGMRIQAAAVSAFLRGEDIEDLMTLQIDQKRAESASTLERKVINTKLGDLPNRLGRQGHNAPENGMERGLYSQPIGDTHAKPTARRQANDLHDLEKPCSHTGPGGHKGGQTLGEDFSWTGGFVTEKCSHRQVSVWSGTTNCLWHREIARLWRP